MPATTPQQQQGILRSLGYDGWHVVSVVPEIRKVAADPNALPGSPEAAGGEQPTGNEQWTIADGKGHNETMVVKPAAAPAGPYENPDDPGASQSTPQVVTPPKNLPASDTAVKNTQTYTAPDGTLYEKDPTTGQWGQAKGVPSGTKTPTPLSGYQNVTDANGRVVAMVDPNDPSRKIDIPAGTRPERPSVVEGSDGAKYSWDGTNLTKLLAGKPEKPQVIQGQNGAIYSYDGTNLKTLQAPTPQAPTTVSANTTDPSIVSRNPDGTLRTDPNPNYKPPVPTTVATNAADATIVRQNADGTISTVPNPNYKPTDVGSQITQLQQKAQTFHDNLTSQVQAGTLDADKAQQQWDDYWKTEVAPQQQAIGAAQDQQRFTNQMTASNAQASRDQYALSSQRDAQTFAQTQGNEAVKSVMDTLPYQVGPQFGADFAKGLNTLSSGGGAVNFSPSDFTFNMPDMESIRHQAVANALKDISPYAASQVGAPIPQVPQGIDINSLLNQSSYGGGFAPQQPAPTTAAPTTTIAPDGTITVQHVAPGGANGGVDTSGADISYAVPAQLPPASNPWSGNVDLSQLD